MNDFERYLQLKEMYSGIADEELKQYLHIVQVMGVEERSLNKHHTELESWLKNIRKEMERKKREAQEAKPLTNFERIKAMTVEEMAKCLTLEILERTADIANADCFLCDETHCTNCLKHWLESEVQENEK